MCYHLEDYHVVGGLSQEVMGSMAYDCLAVAQEGSEYRCVGGECTAGEDHESTREAASFYG